MTRYVRSGLIASLALSSVACGERPPQGAPLDPELWVLRGQTIAQATFTAMSGRLSQAMQEGGIPGALRYCNVAAYPLTDSLSAAYAVTIRRATLRPRNPDNRATGEEAEVIEAYARSLEEERSPQPVVREIDGSTVTFYSPILIQPLCLNCHGAVGNGLSPENAEIIRELYPGDEATGYADGDMRGIWSLRFRR